jgi:hypothetical protein
MSCEVCGSEIDTSKQVEKYKIPFKCSKCGSIDFPLRALNGIVFVWSEPCPDKKGSVYLPNQVKNSFTTNIAVVLSSGPGVTEARTKKFIRSELKTGDLVYRDRDTPWFMDIEAQDGKKYSVPYVNLLDIMTTFTEDPDEPGQVQ